MKWKCWQKGKGSPQRWAGDIESRVSKSPSLKSTRLKTLLANQGLVRARRSIRVFLTWLALDSFPLANKENSLPTSKYQLTIQMGRQNLEKWRSLLPLSWGTFQILSNSLALLCPPDALPPATIVAPKQSSYATHTAAACNVQGNSMQTARPSSVLPHFVTSRTYCALPRPCCAF